MRAFLFDLDGVLVMSEPLVRRGWRRLAERYGVRLDEADFPARILGRRTTDVLEEVFGFDHEMAGRLAGEGIDDKAAELRYGAELPAVPGAVEFVRNASSAGFRIAVVTSASESNAYLALRHIGLVESIHELVDASSVALGKPAPDPYLEACRRLMVAPREAVGFEDSISGVTALKGAGAWCVGLTTSQPAAAMTRADLVIEDFSGYSPHSIVAALTG